MQISFGGKKALVRVDFNVPLDEANKITDDTRIKNSLRTINAILDQGGSVILMSHFGRPLKDLYPDGSLKKSKYTLGHVAPHLASLLRRPVRFVAPCVGTQAETKAGMLGPGEVLMLENTRFHEEEEAADEGFAKELAKLGDVYVNDAFGSAHRAHASTTTVAKFFDPGNRCFGYLMQAEIDHADKVLYNPRRPLIAITGGAKVSDKLLLLDKLIDFADSVIVGGGMAYTFIKAQGGKIGDSICEEDKLQLALDLIEKARKKGTRLLLPVDNVIADHFSNDAKQKTVNSHMIPDKWQGLDIGPESIALFQNEIMKARTIIWNGPMGVFEFERFAHGTNAIAETVVRATQQGAFSLIGGGDSVAALKKNGLDKKVSFLSTGGGAMLEYLEGKVLPGIRAIRDRT